jgi:hypothetical protein
MKFKPILDVGSSALVVKVPIPFGASTHLFAIGSRSVQPLFMSGHEIF